MKNELKQNIEQANKVEKSNSIKHENNIVQTQNIDIKSDFVNNVATDKKEIIQGSDVTNKNTFGFLYNQSMNIISEFIGGFILCVVIGVFLDKHFNMNVFFTVIFIILGAIIGVYNIWKTSIMREDKCCKAKKEEVKK